MKLWIVTALISLMTVAAYPRETKAASISGNNLLEYCENTFSGDEYWEQQADPIDWLNRGTCSGYILGASSGFESGYGTGVYDTGEPDYWCSPIGTTLGQEVRIVLKYLEENPDQLHKNAEFLVAFALFKAFPCE